MKKSIFAIVLIGIIIGLTFAPLVKSFSSQYEKDEKPLVTDVSSKIKIQRPFMLARVFGTIEINGTYFSRNLGNGIYTSIFVNGTVKNDPEQLEFFTIWSPFGFLPWQLWDGLQIQLRIGLFKGIIEQNETTNCVKFQGTGLGILLVLYIDVPWTTRR